MPTLRDFELTPDLTNGVLPISKAASSLAKCIKQATRERRPIIVTQKGYPTGVILSVELFTLLKELVDSDGEVLPFTPDEEGAA